MKNNFLKCKQIYSTRNVHGKYKSGLSYDCNLTLLLPGCIYLLLDYQIKGNSLDHDEEIFPQIAFFVECRIAITIITD